MAKLIFVLICLLLLLSFANAASRFGVGGAGNWSDTAHWSATSNGAPGSSIPGQGDDVNFDNFSTGIATINQNFTIGSLTISGTYAGSKVAGNGLGVRCVRSP